MNVFIPSDRAALKGIINRNENTEMPVSYTHLDVYKRQATVGLTMAVAAQGVIPLQTAIVIILGDNIGTTITAVIA